MPLTRVAVFVDYENARYGAREVFGDPHRRMRIRGRRLWNHALTASHFAQVRDDTDYTVAA